MTPSELYISNLKYLQEQQSLSDGQMANRLRVTKNTYRKWKQREKFPPADYMIAISEIFKVTLDDMVSQQLKQTV